MALPDEERDEEKLAFLPASPTDEQIEPAVQRRPRRAWSYLRLVLELLMVVTIVALAVELLSHTSSRPLKSTPVPQLPRKIYTFLQNSTYAHDGMFATEKDTLHTLHKWIDLSSDARGYIHLENTDGYDLSEPYTVALDRTHDGPGYMMSVFHQLHCLSYLIQHFQSGFAGVALTEEVAHHSAHCIDYLRQSIICSADTSLEGMTEAGPGWGSDHECVDYDALLAWANKHSAYKWRKLIPEEAVL